MNFQKLFTLNTYLTRRHISAEIRLPAYLSFWSKAGQLSRRARPNIRSAASACTPSSTAANPTEPFSPFRDNQIFVNDERYVRQVLESQPATVSRKFLRPEFRDQ